MQKSELIVLKIGGKIVDEDNLLGKVLEDFSAWNVPKILVHGGGKIATEIGHRLGIEAKMHNGRRITDQPTLQVVTMVYGGLINKAIVAKLQSLGIQALGVTGADLDIIRAQKRSPQPIDFGFVGDITCINVPILQKLLEWKITPVFAPLTHDGKGNLFNTNADTIAQEVAVALSQYYEVKLIYSFEKKGVLSNPNDEESYIRFINTASYKQLLSSGIISGGMIPKMENAFEALKRGIASVMIVQADYLKSVREEEFIGTKITL
ncbi:MAG: acetylglutamate kinase [Cytophagales bacterium]|nr:acetylglutamate kinase [Cytophagales bacterium]MDW8384925.1 acetylglutamate kinase [Flammeovirgaceae bacterium]